MAKKYTNTPKRRGKHDPMNDWDNDSHSEALFTLLVLHLIKTDVAVSFL